jgi:hypothetical protein
MPAAIARYKRFILATLSAWLVLALAAGGWSVWGDSIVTDVFHGESLAPLNALMERPPKKPLGHYLAQSEKAWAALLAAAISLQVLFAWIYLIHKAPRRLLWAPLGVVVWWILVDSNAAIYFKPYLDLRNFFYVREPDHLPHGKRNNPEYNRDLLRCKYQPEEFDEQGLNVVLLGDSFTVGYRLRKAEQTSANKLEWMLREQHPERDVKVANFGWVSSSPVLSWRRLATIGDAYHPDYVVMCVDMTDFHDDIKWQNMLDRRGIYWFFDRIPMTLKFLAVNLPQVFEWWHHGSLPNMPEDRYFVVNAPLEETRPKLEQITRSLARIHQWCHERGAEFIVVVLPRSFQFSARESPHNWEVSHYDVLGPWALEPFRFFEELRVKVGYPIYSLLEDFRNTDLFPVCFDDDPHYNENGTTVAARGIFRVLQQEMAKHDRY